LPEYIIKRINIPMKQTSITTGNWARALYIELRVKKH
jgi:hypothetical protein